MFSNNLSKKRILATDIAPVPSSHQLQLLICSVRWISKTGEDSTLCMKSGDLNFEIELIRRGAPRSYPRYPEHTNLVVDANWLPKLYSKILALEGSWALKATGFLFR